MAHMCQAHLPAKRPITGKEAYVPQRDQGYIALKSLLPHPKPSEPQPLSSLEPQQILQFQLVTKIIDRKSLFSQNSQIHPTC